MKGFGAFLIVTAATCALIPWPELFLVWVGVIVGVFFSTLPERSKPRSRAVKPTRGKEA